MDEEKKEKDLSIFEVNDLMLATYNKIAAWHNDDGTSAGLKIISMELVEDIAGATLTHLDIPYKETKILMDDETKKKMEIEKEKLQ